MKSVLLQERMALTKVETEDDGEGKDGSHTEVKKREAQKLATQPAEQSEATAALSPVP